MHHRAHSMPYVHTARFAGSDRAPRKNRPPKEIIRSRAEWVAECSNSPSFGGSDNENKNRHSGDSWLRIHLIAKIQIFTGPRWLKAGLGHASRAAISVIGIVSLARLKLKSRIWSRRFRRVEIPRPGQDHKTPESPAHLAMYIFRNALNSAAPSASFLPRLLIS